MKGLTGYRNVSGINRRWTGYTPDLLKWETLGTCKVHAHGWMRFTAALAEVMRRESQPYNPCYPIREARRFHLAVARAMAVNPEELRLYTAVGSSLQEVYEIDGLFAFQGRAVTINITMDPKDAHTYRGKVLITRHDVVSSYARPARDIALRFDRDVPRNMVLAEKEMSG